MDRAFLELWSREWVVGHDPERDRPLDDEVRAGWLGFAPATPAQVAAAERRLGCVLPPSLRAFLLLTDGWKNTGNFIYRLAGTAELAWPRLLAAMPLWRPVSDNHIAPVVLYTDPLLTELLMPPRGRALLEVPRG
ncbi:SMI1/KNR4 family protein [Dactylosporangium sp. NPDC049525]|uniref:SMI1/KNR4 family protein n=1 Tax=Dactylosporangium sp. NPDC049525 TaxID=3154730 RepID=UPI00342B519E